MGPHFFKCGNGKTVARITVGDIRRIVDYPRILADPREDFSDPVPQEAGWNALFFGQFLP